MPLLDEQRHLQKTGDIRLGVRVPDSSRNGFHPAAIEKFRFTSRSEYAIERVSAQFGGEAREWENDGRRAGWEVITGADTLAVLVPPQQVISQWYEMWRPGTLVRRCDSQTTVVPGGPCQCPHAEDPSDVDEVLRCALLRDEMSKKGDACSRYTRLNLQIPSLPDIGVWRTTTGGFWAAGELAMKAETLRLARDAGAILPAVYRLEPRVKPARPGEKARKYVVPVLELLNSVHEITRGQIPGSLTGAMDMLLERAAPVLAIETAPPGQPRPALTAGQQPADDRARRIYERARAARTGGEFRAIASGPEYDAARDDYVLVDDPAGQHWQLHEALSALWQRKASEGAA